MKRPKPTRRRDRKTGQSPYAKHNKRPCAYSHEYNEWKDHLVGRAKRQEREHSQAQAEKRRTQNVAA